MGGSVFDESIQTVVETGSPLILATASPAGEPYASRGWGLALVDATEGRIRLLLDAEDSVTIANAEAGGSIAITAADVTTLRAVQFKGSCVSVEAATDADRDNSTDHCAKFFATVEVTDGTPRAKLERLVPNDLVAVIVEVRELFNQTPGPRAGETLPST